MAKTRSQDVPSEATDATDTMSEASRESTPAVAVQSLKRKRAHSEDNARATPSTPLELYAEGPWRKFVSKVACFERERHKQLVFELQERYPGWNQTIRPDDFFERDMRKRGNMYVTKLFVRRMRKYGFYCHELDNKFENQVHPDDVDEYRGWFEAPLEANPPGDYFDEDKLPLLHRALQSASKWLVARELTRYLAPSPMHLKMTGDTSDILNFLSESASDRWRLCRNDRLGLPPKPDVTVGFGKSAFTEEQLHKLQPPRSQKNKGFSFCPSDGNMYFPFLTCEARASKGEESMLEAHHQSVHCALFGLQALIRLMRRSSRLADISGKLMFFSVTHNTSRVHIEGFFAVVEGDSVSYRTQSLDPNKDFGKVVESREKSYAFIVRLYQEFAPKLHKQITEALDSISREELWASADE